MKRLAILVPAMLALALLTANAAVAKPVPPQQVAKQTVQEVLKAMAGRREALRNNPQELNTLIKKHLLPVVDVDYMAQLTLGRYWRQLSSDQRQKFIKAFTNMMIAVYGDALLRLKSGENMEYKPVRAPDDAKRVPFTAVYHAPNGPDINLTLKLHLVNGQWKVYDVLGENLSFIANYRNQFTSHIRSAGLDQFVQKMVNMYGTD